MKAKILLLFLLLSASAWAQFQAPKRVNALDGTCFVGDLEYLLITDVAGDPPGLYQATSAGPPCVWAGVGSTVLIPISTLSGAAKGNPVSGASNGSLFASPIYLDASAFAGADFSVKTSAAITASANNVVVNAMAFSGDQGCSQNPIPTTNPIGRLLLGTGFNCHIQATWVLPASFKIQGSGWSATANSVGGTQLTLCNGSDPTCGATTFAGPILCWGQAGVCGTGSLTGSMVSEITFNGNNVSAAWGVRDDAGQEDSGCERCKFINFGNSSGYGTVTTPNGVALAIGLGGSGAQNSIWRDLSINVLNKSGNVCTATYVPLIVDTGGAANAGPKEISDLTINNSTCNSNGSVGAAPFPTDSLMWSAANGKLDSIHLEGFAGAAIHLGVHVAANAVAGQTSNNLTLLNINATNGYSASGIAGAATSITMSGNTITGTAGSSWPAQVQPGQAMKITGCGTTTAYNGNTVVLLTVPTTTTFTAFFPGQQGLGNGTSCTFTPQETTLAIDNQAAVSNVNLLGIKNPTAGGAFVTIPVLISDVANLANTNANSNGTLLAANESQNSIGHYLIGGANKSYFNTDASEITGSDPGSSFGVDTMSGTAPVPNCALGNVHREVVSAATVIGPPINCADGQPLIFQVRASNAGPDNVTFNAVYTGSATMAATNANNCTEVFTYDASQNTGQAALIVLAANANCH